MCVIPADKISLLEEKDEVIWKMNKVKDDVKILGENHENANKTYWLLNELYPLLTFTKNTDISTSWDNRDSNG